MTIFQLECFWALAQSLNFTQAAAQQYITQPALSRSILALEQELGIVLVNRTRQRVSLTPAGQVFTAECRKMIDVYQSGVQRARLATEQLIGSVRLGVPNDSFEPLAVRLVRVVAARHPGVHIELKFNSPTALVRALDDDLVDIIVASGKPRTNGAQSILLQRREDCAVFPVGHPLAEREHVNFSELRHENFVVISRSSSVAGYESVITKASDAGFTPNIIWEADTVSSVLMQVACGMGVSVLYREHQRLCGDDVAFVPLTGCQPFDRHLIWKDNDDPCLATVVSVAGELYAPANPCG